MHLLMTCRSLRSICPQRLCWGSRLGSWLADLQLRNSGFSIRRSSRSKSCMLPTATPYVYVPDDVVDRTLLGGDGVKPRSCGTTFCPKLATLAQQWTRYRAISKLLHGTHFCNGEMLSATTAGPAADAAATPLHQEHIESGFSAITASPGSISSVTRKPCGYYFCDQCKWVTMYGCALSLVPNFDRCLNAVKRMPVYWIRCCLWPGCDFFKCVVYLCFVSVLFCYWFFMLVLDAVWSSGKSRAAFNSNQWCTPANGAGTVIIVMLQINMNQKATDVSSSLVAA